MTFEEYHTLLFPDDILTEEGTNFIINFYKIVEGVDTPSVSTLTDTFLANLTMILKDSDTSAAETKEKLAEAALQFYKQVTHE